MSRIVSAIPTACMKTGVCYIFTDHYINIYLRTAPMEMTVVLSAYL